MDESAVGRTGQPVTMAVELGKIREFARAIKDDNPIYYEGRGGCSRKLEGGVTHRLA